VHLRDDHPLGAVDDERALVGHERDVAHVDVLLLDVLDGPGAGFLFHLEHDETELHLERRGIGHVALDAFLDVVLRLLELVGDIFEHRALVEVLDREDGLEDRLDALVATFAAAHFALQELFVGGTLNLDEVRHLHSFGDAAERLPDPLLAGEGLRHVFPCVRGGTPRVKCLVASTLVTPGMAGSGHKTMLLALQERPFATVGGL